MVLRPSQWLSGCWSTNSVESSDLFDVETFFVWSWTFQIHRKFKIYELLTMSKMLTLQSSNLNLRFLFSLKFKIYKRFNMYEILTMSKMLTRLSSNLNPRWLFSMFSLFSSSLSGGSISSESVYRYNNARKLNFLYNYKLLTILFFTLLLVFFFILHIYHHISCNIYYVIQWKDKNISNHITTMPYSLNHLKIFRLSFLLKIEQITYNQS